MTDRIQEAFLKKQEDEALALASESDLLNLAPIGQPASRYLAEFTCKGLVEQGPGEIAEAQSFGVGIWFPSTYLRAADPFQVLTWLGPRNIWHPNISATAPAICVGRLAPGTGLVVILYQVFEIIPGIRVTMRKDDAVIRPGCQWARQHRDRFPVDRRPLKRRPPVFHVGSVSERRQADGQGL